MFLVKKGTVIQISSRFAGGPRWIPYTTKEDKVYDKHEVLDRVAFENGRDIPEWAVRNITVHNKVILCKNGKYALVNPKDITYLD